ncbi:insulinase family protein [Candidatus Peregrinibacteria bacterium]|jgi:predicted Zn-dependent peptidase|nr:insulinase family protein [Candidatus Peregrinibacteria bacterium]MBT7702662.1 insulinase family protein [Candidatus Peregrinibacteria bacterium]
MKKAILPSGLRVLTQKIEGTKSVTVLILAKAGSRCETRDIRGLSHFLEHMFFKGGEKYPNTKAVSEAIDSIGGEFNAFTGKEYVGYYVKVASNHKDLAMDVLADMLITAKLDQKEIDKERGVILEEYNMYQDTPMYQVGWDFEKLMFGDQPMGWDQIGLKEVINKLGHDDFVKYKNELYRPDNLVVSVAGDVSHDELVAAVGEKFKMEAGETDFAWQPVTPNDSEDRVILQKKKTEQGHVVVGVPGYPESHDDSMAMKLLAIILGGNMSSRMFLNVREAQGLAYYIQSSTDDYTDVGVISTRAGVDLNRVDFAVEAICKEYADVRDNGVSEAELQRAKDYLKGKMVLKLEDSEEYAHLLAKYEVLYKKARTPESVVELVERVTIDDIARISKEIFQEDKLYMAGIGPWDDKERFAKLLKV